MSALARSTISSDGPGAAHRHRLQQSSSSQQEAALDKTSSGDPSSLAVPFYEPTPTISNGGQPGASDEQGSPAQPPTPANPKRRPNALNRAASPRDGPVAAKDISKTPVRASWGPAPNVSTPPSAVIDPLSQHILMRTNTENTSSPRLRYSARPDSPGPDVLQRLGSDSATKHSSAVPVDVVKDKRKGASFLSRLSMRGRKNLKDDDLFDDGSEIGEPRPSGSDARVFSSSIGAGGYIPHHKEPPRYIKVRAHNKKHREFNRIFLAQQLSTRRTPEDRPSDTTQNGGDRARPTNGGAIWAMEFSKDGKYLAAAGMDQVVRVWSVISTAEERRQHEEDESADKANDERLSAPVFRSKPYREFTGHCGEVLDLSWSKNNFLLSSSMDKTVRLWHLSRPECLCTFKHKDFVTSIAFHPTDDRFFLAGSLDAHLRLWSIPDKSVAFDAQLPDLVTAVAFCPDGKIAIGGVLSGMCLFYETEGLKLLSQMPVRSSRGKNAKGSKITGIKTMTFPPDSTEGEVKILVTSNDSRIRLYRLKDRSLEAKFKGHQNVCSQVHASFSDDARHIICGSEDKRAFLWSLHPDDPDAQEKAPCEYFDAHPARVSATVMAPTKTRQLLSASGDPLYDLCNPPPVKLVSLEERLAASQPNMSDSQPQAQVTSSQSPKESPAYLEKSRHPDGNIIVTADQDGLIKVFRQDCAFVKRRHEVWETGSNFSRVVGQGTLLGRSGSIITRTSASSHPRSRRTSLSQPPLGTGMGTQGAHMSSDRINSWRYGIDSGRNSHRSSLIGAASIRSERSMSPSRLGALPASAEILSTVAASNDRKKSPPPSLGDSLRISKRSDTHENSSQPPTPSFSFRPVAEDEEPRSDGVGSNYSFWNLNRWRGISAIRTSNLSPSPGLLTPRTVSTPAKIRVSSESRRGEHASLKSTTGPQDGGPPLKAEDSKVVGVSGDDDRRQTELLQPEDCDPYSHGRRGERLHSVVSRLSVEYTSEEDNSTRVCDKCGSRDFKHRRMAGIVRLLCTNCGKVVEDDDV